jgi:hypothetical protein
MVAVKSIDFCLKLVELKWAITYQFSSLNLAVVSLQAYQKYFFIHSPKNIQLQSKILKKRSPLFLSYPHNKYSVSLNHYTCTCTYI